MHLGDSRGDVHPAFTMLHVIFLRNHNILAEKLKNVQPDWNDERLYQEARKINSAIFQHITYTQFLDALLGEPNDIVQRDGLEDLDYDDTVDGSIDLVFSTAAF